MLISAIKSSMGERFVLQMKKFGYLTIFSAPLIFMASMWVGKEFNILNYTAWFTLFFIYAVVPFLDVLVGSEKIDPAKFSKELNLKDSKYYTYVLFMCIPLEITMILLAGNTFFSGELNTFGQVGMLVSLGFVSGSLAINVSHELVHRIDPKENWAGGLLLSLVCFGSFKIDHIMHHHVWAVTPEDHLAARRGQSVYNYVLFSNLKRTISAWKTEARRLTAAKIPVYSLNNQMIYWYSMSVLWGLLFGFIWGPKGFLFFLVQSMIAIAMMDIITYIEHYGLLRKKNPSGRYDRMTVNHSWNSNYFLTNLFLFNLPRHSDHHVYPNRKVPTFKSLQRKSRA